MGEHMAYNRQRVAREFLCQIWYNNTWIGPRAKQGNVTRLAQPTAHKAPIDQTIRKDLVFDWRASTTRKISMERSRVSRVPENGRKRKEEATIEVEYSS